MVKQKTVHDGNTRKDASVTAKGTKRIPSSEHWESNMDLTPSGAPTAAGAFLPMRSKDRPQPHKMVNECDH